MLRESDVIRSTPAIPKMLRGSPPTRGSGPGRSLTNSRTSSATSTRIDSGRSADPPSKWLAFRSRPCSPHAACSSRTGSGVGRTGTGGVMRTVSPSRLAEQRKRSDPSGGLRGASVAKLNLAFSGCTDYSNCNAVSTRLTTVCKLRSKCARRLCYTLS
jgi:hypothetical protein